MLQVISKAALIYESVGSYRFCLLFCQDNIELYFSTSDVFFGKSFQRLKVQINLQCSASMFGLWNVEMHNIMAVCVFIIDAFHTIMSQEVVAM